MGKNDKLSPYRPLLIALCCCLYGGNRLAAQWTQKDSLWLENVISGKEKIKLNLETTKAIEEGRFIQLDEPAGRMRLASPKLPITKDFSEYLKPDEDTLTHRHVALRDLPPAVFMRYGLDKPLPRQGMLVMATRAYEPDEKLKILLRKGGGSATALVTMDANHLLSMAFSRHYRQLEHNKTHATAWRNYNNLPTAQVHAKQRRFRAAHPELILPHTTQVDSSRLRLSLLPDSLRLDRSTHYLLADSVTPHLDSLYLFRGL